MAFGTSLTSCSGASARISSSTARDRTTTTSGHRSVARSTRRIGPDNSRFEPQSRPGAPPWIWYTTRAPQSFAASRCDRSRQ